MAQVEWPIYDDEYPYEQIGVVTEAKWEWADLTPEERTKLHTDATLLVMQSAERTPDDPITDDFALAYTLSHHGIACFHRWRYTNDPRGVPFMRDCSMCMTSEPLPGEVYKVGDRWMRLSVPPPPMVCIPRPVPVQYVAYDDPSPFGAAPPVDEYRWNGRAYEPA